MQLSQDFFVSGLINISYKSGCFGIKSLRIIQCKITQESLKNSSINLIPLDFLMYQASIVFKTSYRSQLKRVKKVKTV